MHDPDYTMPEDEVYNKLRRKLSHYGLEQLQANYGAQLKTEPLLQQIARKWEDMDKLGADTIVMTGESKDVYRAILNLQRDWLTDKNRHPNIDEDIIRMHLLYLDLEEERIELL